MKGDEFLKQLSGVEPRSIWDGFEYDEWPTDQSFYLQVAEEMFPDPYDLSDEDFTHQALDDRQRLTDLLGGFLNRDGRSFNAIMYIANTAFSDDVIYKCCAVSSLAHLHVYLRHRCGRIPVNDEEFLSMLLPLCDFESTYVNSQGLIRFLIRRNM